MDGLVWMEGERDPNLTDWKDWRCRCNRNWFFHSRFSNVDSIKPVVSKLVVWANKIKWVAGFLPFFFAHKLANSWIVWICLLSFFASLAHSHSFLINDYIAIGPFYLSTVCQLWNEKNVWKIIPIYRIMDWQNANNTSFIWLMERGFRKEEVGTFFGTSNN